MPRFRHFVVVEEVYSEAEEIIQALKKNFPKRKVRLIEHEAGFRANLDRLAAEPPALIVLDVMLRWEKTRPNRTPRPVDVAAEGYRRAGIRCQRLLAARPETEHVPVILFTQLQEEDLKDSLTSAPNHIRYLAKGQGVEALIKLAKHLVRT